MMDSGTVKKAVAIIESGGVLLTLDYRLERYRRSILMFITFEGVDGCGKSTQIKKLGNWMRSNSIPHMTTREPGGTGLPIGDDIRRLIMTYPNLQAETLIHLFVANRIEHIAQTIKPALELDLTVICDRYADSTYAYQMHGLCGSKALESSDGLSKVSGGLFPDLTIWVDTPLKSTLNRLQQRAHCNHIDARSIEFHQRVYEGFAYLHSLCPNRIKRVDGVGTTAEVFERILGIYKETCS